MSPLGSPATSSSAFGVRYARPQQCRGLEHHRWPNWPTTPFRFHSSTPPPALLDGMITGQSRPPIGTVLHPRRSRHSQHSKLSIRPSISATFAAQTLTVNANYRPFLLWCPLETKRTT